MLSSLLKGAKYQQTQLKNSQTNGEGYKLQIQQLELFTKHSKLDDALKLVQNMDLMKIGREIIVKIILTKNVEMLQFLVEHSPIFKSQIMLAIESYKDEQILDSLFKNLDPRGKKMLDILIDNGANQIEIQPNIVTNMIGAAAATNNQVILKYLIGKFKKEQIEFKCYKLDINLHNQILDGNEGKTPLMLCVDNSCPIDCLTILVKAGANTQCSNKNGINIFHIAATEKRIDMLIYLLQNTNIDIFYQKAEYIESPDELCKMFFTKLEYSQILQALISQPTKKELKKQTKITGKENYKNMTQDEIKQMEQDEKAASERAERESQALLDDLEKEESDRLIKSKKKKDKKKDKKIKYKLKKSLSKQPKSGEFVGSDIRSKTSREGLSKEKSSGSFLTLGSGFSDTSEGVITEISKKISPITGDFENNNTIRDGNQTIRTILSEITNTGRQAELDSISEEAKTDRNYDFINTLYEEHKQQNSKFTFADKAALDFGDTTKIPVKGTFMDRLREYQPFISMPQCTPLNWCQINPYITIGNPTARTWGYRTKRSNTVHGQATFRTMQADKRNMNSLRTMHQSYKLR